MRHGLNHYTADPSCKDCMYVQKGLTQGKKTKHKQAKIDIDRLHESQEEYCKNLRWLNGDPQP